MSGRTIEIDVILNDKTNGGVKGIQKDLQALDKQAERLNQRIKAIGLQKFAATLRLIDKVSDPASRINSLLKKIAGGTYRVTMRINDSALAGIRKIESALLRITGRAWSVAVNVKGAAMNKLNGMMSGALMGAGMFAPMAGMMGVGYGVGNAISSAASFEQEMSRVQAIRQLSKDSQDMKDMYALAKKLGMETAWTRQQVGEAMRYQALAGWETPQILKATPHMLNLASAGGMDLGAASDMLTDAMTAFGLKATDQYTNAKGQAIDLPEYFADMFAKVQASSNTDLYQLKEATKYSASTIGTMFANIGGQEGVQARTEAARQMLIMAGLMANAGIKGSMAGTGINTIFNRLAGENRNTFYASNKLLGIDPTDDKHNMIMPLEYIKAFRDKIRGGMSVDDFLQVAEELSGEKIHADTRRKINSTIESAIKNGGKLGSSDMLKIGSMMAGLENAPKLMAMVFQDIEALEAKMNNVEGTAGQMAETMLDNLAGSFTKLGSAWDAFQQDLFTGTAGDGLRNFVDALTEILTRANKLFQDGIDISDFGKIIGDVVGRLKDKFMELDGIGSLLAGGALVMGLRKIISLGQSALNVFKGVGAAGATALGGAAAKGAAGAAAGMSVSTMNVKAGVVNLAGAVKGGGGGVAGTAGKGAAGAAALTPVALAQQNLAKARAAQDTALAAAWAAPGVAWRQSALRMAQRQTAQAEAALVNARVAAYNEQIAKQKQALALAREEAQVTSRFAGMKSAAGGAAAFAGLFSLLDVMSLKSANAERLAAAPEDQRAQVMIENRKAEWEAGAGAAGSIFGAAAGAALGSMAGPMGTMIGGMIGSMIGETIGEWLGRNNENSDKPPQGEKDYFGFNEQLELGDSARRRAADMEEAARRPYEALRVLDSARRRQLDLQEAETRKQLERFEKIDQKLGAFSPFRYESASLARANEYYQQQATNLDKATAKVLPALGGLISKYLDVGNAVSQKAAQDFYQQGTSGAADVKPVSALSAMLENLFFSRTQAAELNPEQQMQMAAMEGGTVASKVAAPFALPEAGMPPEMPDITSMTEQIYSDLEALQEGVSEVFSGFGEQITEQLTTAFEGVGEIFANFGTTITEGLTTTFTGAGEQFAQFGTMISEGMTSAQTAAESSMTAIQTTFTTTKDTIQAAWGELPGFFANVFSGLGGAASAAGAAIEAELTAPIGSIIGAWQGAAAQISSIISSISAQAAAMPSIPTGGGNIPAHAEGGFITSPEFALIGERGAELILPLTDKERSRELLRQASGVLGLNSEEDGYSISGGSLGGGSMSVSVGGITVNFEINGSDSTNVMDAIKENLQEIGDKVAAQISKSVGNVFQNQMVVA